MAQAASLLAVELPLHVSTKPWASVACSALIWADLWCLGFQ